MTPRLLRPLLSLALLGVPAFGALVPRPAAAADSDAELQRRAREAYEIGLRHYKIGDWAVAVEKFKEAYVIRPDPSFLFNIGQAYRQLGDAPAAIRAYRNYLKDRPAAPNRKEVEAFIRDLEAGPVKSPPARPTPAPAEPVAPREGPPPASGSVDPAAQPPANPDVGGPPPSSPAASSPGGWSPPPAVAPPESPARSLFGFEAWAGFSYRYLYQTSFVGAEAGARIGTRAEHSKLFFSLRVFGGQGLPGITTIAVSPGFVGQGRIGRVYLGGGAHVSWIFLSGPVGKELLWDQAIGASVDVDVAVARWGRRELLVGATAAVDLLLGSLIGDNNGTPVMSTVIAHAGFGF